MSDDFFALHPLKPGRMHELHGPGAWVFALALGARLGGTVLWVRQGWQTEALHPAGVSPIMDSGDLLVANARDQTEVLAVAEEGLRSGAVPLVVMELTRPLDLTTGRRLQLAARDGGVTALAILPEGMGSNAAESRWLCQPIFDPVPAGPDSTLQNWRLTKNKSGTLGDWNVRWDTSAGYVRMVPPAGQRPGLTRMPD